MRDMNSLIASWAHVARPVIGMLHAPALPGAPHYQGNLQAVRDAVLRDADTLAESGVHGLMLENFFDAPFYPAMLPSETVSHLTALAVAVKSRVDLPLGINALRNDGMAALSIAHAAGAQFIRVNVLTGASVTDQGLIQGIAHILLRHQAHLRATDIRLFADIDVKHAAPLAPRPLAQEAKDTVQRGGADALILTGHATGSPADAARLNEAKSAGAPVFIGSGVTAQNIRDFLPQADGFIVGTSLKENGDPAAPVDSHRVRDLMQALK